MSEEPMDVSQEGSGRVGGRTFLAKDIYKVKTLVLYLNIEI